MSYTVDSLTAGQTLRASYTPYTSESGGEVFASYLANAMEPAVTADEALSSDPAMAMQSVMSLMLSSGMDDPSSGILSVILMYLLMGRDDTALPQVEQAYTSPSPEAAETAAKTIADFTENDGIVQSALTRLGDPYSQKKAGSDDYTDCSYLTRWCYRAAGVELPRTAAAQAKYLEDQGQAVTRDELKTGDLIFYSFKKNGRYKNISHVGIYAGNGKMIDASSANGKVVYRDMFDGAVSYARPKLPSAEAVAL